MNHPLTANSTAATNSSTNLSIVNNSNVKVYIRFRPICNEKLEQPIDYESNQNEIQLRKANHQSRNYCFDGLFNDQARQQDLSEVIIDPLIQQVKEGFNCTVLAYGQTGTGKTYTIQGDYFNNIKSPLAESSTNAHQPNKQLPDKAGLVPRAFYKLFNLLTPDDQFKVSVIEIYNEEVFDLLADNSEPMRVYESQKGVTLNNLKEYSIKSANDLNAILQKSNSKRQVASTSMNEHSSRSHVIFQFVLHTKETMKNNQVVERVGKLNLVDLAGSECAKRTGCQDMRALEASKINRSLLTLTLVIDSLVKNQKYIPFRNSKLTRILQDTLGGNSKTVLIATLSPALIDFEDTISTLTFASTVKQVKNNASANVKVIQNNYYEERLKEMEENLALERNKHEEELIQLRAKIEEIKQNHELELKSKYEDLEEIESQLETKVDENKCLKREISRLNDDLTNRNLYHKENDTLKQPATKKQRTSTKPLSNAANNKIRRSTKVSNGDNPGEIAEEFVKSIKNDVNALFKEHNLLTKRVNKMKTLLTGQENQLKELNKSESKDKLVCNDQLSENLGSFMYQMFNIAIQDDFDLFYEFLTSNIQPELSEDLAQQLEEQFIEFRKYVDEKLELVKETADNTISSNEEQLERKTQAIRDINEITGEFKKEITETIKMSKKCKDKVKSMKDKTSA